MKKVNAAGPEVIGNLPMIPALAPATFKEMVDEEKYQLVDTRTMLGIWRRTYRRRAQHRRHAGSLIWAGWLLDPEKPILLVLESDSDVEKVSPAFCPHRLYEIRRLSRRRNAGLAECRISAARTDADDGP